MFSSTRQIAEDLGRLEHPGNAHLVDLVGLAPQHRLPVEHDRAGVGISLPTRQFSRVDLPAPFGPMMACTEFSATLRFTSPAPADPPKRLLTSLTSRIPWSVSSIPQADGAVFGSASDSCAGTTADPLATFDQTTGQKDHHQHEQQPSVRCQPLPMNGCMIVTTKFSSPSGRKANQLCRTLSLIFEKMFSKYLMKPRPGSGPSRFRRHPGSSSEQPRRLRSMNIRLAPASGSIAARRPPARPAYMPEMTKAASV